MNLLASGILGEPRNAVVVGYNVAQPAAADQTLLV